MSTLMHNIPTNCAWYNVVNQRGETETFYDAAWGQQALVWAKKAAQQIGGIVLFKNTMGIDPNPLYVSENFLEKNS